jgi:very-short-patch-repair endonuclease
MLVTGKILEQGKSKRGAWSRAQVEALGVSWPLTGGWKKNLIGKEVSEEQVAEFLALKDVHKRCERIQPTIEVLERRKLFRQKRRAFSAKRGLMARDPWSVGNRGILLSKDNAAEQHMDRLLSELPVRYRREHPLNVDGKKYFIDFLVTSFKDVERRWSKVRIAIEVDGGYHYTPEQQEKDRRKEADLLATCRVWTIVRIDAAKAMKMDANELEAVLRNVQIGAIHKHS